MSVLKPLYGSNNVSIAVALNSLASAVYASSAVIDNTSNLYTDIKVQFIWKNGASVAGTPIVSVYLAESSNNGTNYSDGVTASATPVPTSPPNMKLLYTLSCPTASTSYTSDPFYIAAGVGLPMLPDKSILVFLNGTGGTSDATAGNFSVFYEGLNLQAV